MLKPPGSPLRIAQPDQMPAKEQKTFNSRMRQIEKLRARFRAWDASSAAYQQQYTPWLKAMRYRIAGGDFDFPLA